MELGFVHDLQIGYVNKDGLITPIEINAKVVNAHSQCADTAAESRDCRRAEQRGLFQDKV